jgi:hypothetical protein
VDIYIRDGFQAAIPVLERSKTVFTLDRADIMLGDYYIIIIIIVII